MHRRVLWRGVPLPAGAIAARPDEGSSLLMPYARAFPLARTTSTRPAALLGFSPFAGLLPQPGGHAAQVRRLNRSAAFLPDRAHVPFVPAHPSRFVFVGMIGRRLGNK
jgi:hypothetical protein